MRLHLWILAASGRLVCADWALGQKLDYQAGYVDSLLPRETTTSSPDGVNGWTPRPTQGPPTELVRRRQEWAKRHHDMSNTWINDKTCGWLADEISEPFVCGENELCATNSDHVIDCITSGEEDPFSTFFTVCFDYSAYENGLCETAAQKTGCCMTESIGECITYVWPGQPEKSMFRCYSERMRITMLETPPGLETSTSTTSTSTETSETEEPSATPSNDDDDEDGDDDDDADDETPTTRAPSLAASSAEWGGIALIAGIVAFFIIRSRKSAANTNIGGATPGYSAVAPNDPAYHNHHPGSPMQSVAGYPPSYASPQMSQAGYYGPNSNPNPGNNAPPTGSPANNPPDTPFLSNTTTPPPPSASPIYNTASYYDPPKDGMAHQPPSPPQPGNGFGVAAHMSTYGAFPGAPTPPPPPPPPPAAAGQVPYPGAGAGGAGGYGPYPPQPVSELDPSSTPMGQHSNPAEMAGDTPARR
ncbi:hypothetical protein VTH06DRAFT_6794 [Thermothelomyces fergusii]